MDCHRSSCSPFCLFFFFFFFFTSIMLFFTQKRVNGSTVGVTWGTQSSHLLPYEAIVEMMRENNIKRVRLLGSNNGALRALSNTGIEVMVGVPNNLLITMLDIDEANRWVENTVARYILLGTKIRYVGVGNEPYLKAYNDTYSASTFLALRNIQRALMNANMEEQVKVTVPLNADALNESGTPSDSVFREDITHDMLEIVGFLAENQCPFTLNIYPFLTLGDNNNKSSLPLDYAFFDPHTSPPITDGEYTYLNAFDATYDALVVALTKAGYSNMSIIVGGIGWPTDGHANATPDNAMRFNQGFLDHVLSEVGTPRRPNTPIHFYLSSLIDEDMRSVSTTGGFERHWGMLRYDGVPKYALSLSGSSKTKRRRALVSVPGVRYLDKKWCVLNTDVVDTSTLPDSILYACMNADCTPLGLGCSCYPYLDDVGNASYAFNAYFQRQNQQMGSCSFDGLGHIVTVDPSINTTCPFMVQIAYGSSSTTKVKVTHVQVLVGLCHLLVFIMVLL